MQQQKEGKMTEIRKREMKLCDYGITRKKYNELKYFCAQYREKKNELRHSYGITAAENDGMPKGNKIGNPTQNRAVRNDMLQKDIELIEQTAIEADNEIYEYILKNIADGTPYEWMDVPKGRKQFYESRRYFFYLLSQKR